MKDVAKNQKTITSRGIKFPHDRMVIPWRQRKLLRNNRYEEKESRAVLQNLRPEDRVIELGAGIGYMSSLMALKVGIRDVHAFEANPRMIPFIENVHAMNDVKGVTIHNAVLGDHAGTAEFYNRRDYVASSLAPLPTDDDQTLLSIEKIEMRDAGDTFRTIAPTALVCDIEGAEVDLLPLCDLSSVRCAIVEMHPQWVGSAGVAKVFATMTQAGLTYHHRGSQGKVVTFRRDW
ncbi:hypothetical protein ACMU_12460 [Actibacterium mucosum KCTC 23349]|uniref:Uncharacterized protein n=1 Tax=Actibacterium mucosum KCTC 23349 TaxID=1454373 RepID=A0A037ZIP4_9RHOB|nr:FkbM family methyltransferase [Actibacterium mucosum]KAJ55499.1 hypothetical protein ACMU_12460 [Actibacterium mucosum KCTC 23349]